MPRPRKALATNKKHFTAAEKEARAASEAAFKVDRADLCDFDSLKNLGLSEAAQKEYQRIVKAAWWIIDSLDRNDLINFCICWQRALSIASSPDAQKEIILQTRGDGSRKVVKNPMWEIWDDCCRQMRSISGKLGLSQVDRLKLVAPTDAETATNKFLRFLRKEG